MGVYMDTTQIPQTYKYIILNALREICASHQATNLVNRLVCYAIEFMEGVFNCFELFVDVEMTSDDEGNHYFIAKNFFIANLLSDCILQKMNGGIRFSHSGIYPQLVQTDFQQKFGHLTRSLLKELFNCIHDSTIHFEIRLIEKSPYMFIKMNEEAGTIVMQQDMSLSFGYAIK